MIDSKQPTIANIFTPLKKFTKARFDCTMSPTLSSQIILNDNPLTRNELSRLQNLGIDSLFNRLFILMVNTNIKKNIISINENFNQF